MMFMKEMTVNQAIEISDKAMQILNDFNIDTCCGGNLSIEEGAKTAHVNIDQVMAALNSK